MPSGSVQPFGWSKYPYSDAALSAAPGVKQLYDDFGDEVNAPWWLGLAWHEGDNNPSGPNPSPPFRQYIWLTHQASPVLFAAVGNNARISFTNQNGTRFNNVSAREPANFMEAFVNDAFIPTSNDGRANTPKLDRFNFKPHFFTIDGHSEHFSHNNAAVTPMLRVGEPCLIRVINAGLWTHSMHIHANHVYVTAINNVPQENPFWVDVFTLHHPKIGTIKKAFVGRDTVDIAQRQSPLCFPMHDHSEPSLSTQGGNYNTALISGLYFIGDQVGPMKDFPIDEDF